MKKQILFLTMFTLALIFAGTTNSIGQTIHPLAVGCAVTEGPLSPLLGKTYNYAVTVNISKFTTGGENSTTYDWWVTQDPDILDAGVWATPITPGTASDFEVITTGSGAKTTSTDQLVDNIDISWNTPATALVPFFLVVTVKGTNTDGDCVTQNTKVYKIIPVNQFTLDLVNYNTASGEVVNFVDDLAPDYDPCISPIQSIIWPGTVSVADEHAIYDYGTDSIVWAVAAANWSNKWTPSLQLVQTNVTSTITSFTWNTAVDGTGTGGVFTNTSVNLWNTVTGVTPQSGTDVGQGGEVIYIKIKLDHSVDATTFNEGLVDQGFNLAIDGTLANGDHDVHWTDTASDGTPGSGTANCGEEDQYENDIANQTLKKRPTVTSNTGTGPDPLLIPEGSN